MPGGVHLAATEPGPACGVVKARSSRFYECYWPHRILAGEHGVPVHPTVTRVPLQILVALRPVWEYRLCRCGTPQGGVDRSAARLICHDAEGVSGAVLSSGPCLFCDYPTACRNVSRKGLRE